MLLLTRPLIFGFLIVFLSACSHYYYRPNPLPMAHIDEKNDVFVGLGIAGDLAQNGVDARAAFSPADHLVISGSFIQSRSGQYRSTSDSWAGNTLAELGIGYYQRRSEAMYSIMGGYGYGWSNHHFGSQRYAELNIHRVFLQSSATVNFDNFRIAGGLRMVYLDYFKGDIDAGIGSVSDPATGIDAIRLIEQGSPFIFPEIGFEMCFSYDPIVLGLSSALSLSQDAGARRFQTTTFGFNLGLNIHKLFQKKKK